MRAVSVHLDAGEPRLAIEACPEPAPAADEAVVAVKAVSLNNGEIREAFAAGAGHRPGWDLAGVVASAPAGSGFSSGDRVVGLKLGGAWAERVAVPTRLLAPLPAGLPFEAAAVLPVAGMTAAIALSKKPPAPGDKVLVTAATGGVGQLAIQLASAAGAHVTAYVRDERDAPLVRSLGAHAVAVGSDALGRLGPYDLAFEGVGGRLLGSVLECLAARGLCVQFGDAGGDEPTSFDAKRFRLGPGGAFGGTTLYGFFLAEELTRPGGVQAGPLLSDLAQRLSTGALDPGIRETRSWRDIDEVARGLMARRFKGKAVLRID